MSDELDQLAITFTEDIAARFLGHGWNVLRVGDANDVDRIEQGSTLGWDRYVGAKGEVVGMHTFGASAPLKELQTKFGFEPEPRRVVLRGR